MNISNMKSAIQAGQKKKNVFLSIAFFGPRMEPERTAGEGAGGARVATHVAVISF